jgi:hypothetical protein
LSAHCFFFIANSLLDAFVEHCLHKVPMPSGEHCVFRCKRLLFVVFIKMQCVMWIG